MKTPYLDLYIETLEKDKKLGLNSFYQNCKLRELKEVKKQLTLTDVVKSFYCFEESMNMQLKCDSECTYCKSIKIEQ